MSYVPSFHQTTKPRRTFASAHTASAAPFAVAIDLDYSFARDVATMSRLINCFIKAGHKVYLISMGCVAPEIPAAIQKKVTGIHCTKGQPKREYMARLGLAVDTWMEDRPESLVMTRSQTKEVFVPPARKTMILRSGCRECGATLGVDTILPDLSEAEITGVKESDPVSDTIEYFNSKHEGKDVVVKYSTVDRCRSC